MNFFAGAYQYTENKSLTQDEKVLSYHNLVAEHTRNYLTPLPLPPGEDPRQFDVFDYKERLDYWSISYVALRDLFQINRFAKDPAFNLVFINEKVAIFQVTSKFRGDQASTLAWTESQKP
jgi:hypothetical protein